MASPATSYPTKAAIERAVAAARACKITVGGFEVTPDGVIRILPAAPTEANAFDQWREKRQKG